MRTRDQTEELDLLPSPAREIAESKAGKFGPKSVIPVKLVKFFTAT